MDQRILKVLETWHGGEDERGRINCYLSMAGELGEIINLYRKWFFKPGYEGIGRETLLDEWGDLWYYIRLYAHFNKLELPFVNSIFSPDSFEGFAIHNLVLLDREISQILENELNILEGGLDEKETLQNLVNGLGYFLLTLSCSFDELTELNYQKLTKNEDHHGWKNEPSPLLSEDYKVKHLGFDKGSEEGDYSAEISELSPTEYKRLYQNEWVTQEAEKDLEDTFVNKEELEDWREAMQRRIRANEQRSRELRGRWY